MGGGNYLWKQRMKFAIVSVICATVAFVTVAYLLYKLTKYVLRNMNK